MKPEEIKQRVEETARILDITHVLNRRPKFLSGGQAVEQTIHQFDIIRYFMTIPEAASLVLQAASIAKGGELFVLDMGKPVKIRELAERMIQLYADPNGPRVEIVYTGLRPGEKLFEEKLMEEEKTFRRLLVNIVLAFILQQMIRNLKR